ncbi:cuticle protein 10.9 [Trichonephila inaurata madagascariensis]|uniref:Cuticle protein 10.9 n=1 Tax=Trichonephila inaurata madagascariensis TaxID=2747483 RepID=A0A8X6XPM4_9ARAC|nr:cuticle protein 10.9 [Trichonephila inaurata madagascariensis]
MEFLKTVIATLVVVQYATAKGIGGMGGGLGGGYGGSNGGLGGGLGGGYGGGMGGGLGGGYGGSNGGLGGGHGGVGGGYGGGMEEDLEVEMEELADLVGDTENQPRPYTMGYKAEGEEAISFRSEEGDAHGKKVGTYGYMDAQGLYRKVQYTAGADGFHAIVQTNEPGTDGKENPADVIMIVEEPPAGIQEKYTRSSGYGHGGQGGQGGYGGMGGGYGGMSGIGGGYGGMGGGNGGMNGGSPKGGVGGFYGGMGARSGKSGY